MTFIPQNQAGLRTGISAKACVIPGEDAGELESLTRDYHQQWQPATPLECFLVDALVHGDWQLRRLRRIEAQLWTSQLAAAGDSGSPLGDTYSRALDAFTRLQRRIDSTERSYFRALTQLQRLNAGIRPATDENEPASSLRPRTPDPVPELASFRNIPSAAKPLTSAAVPHVPVAP